MRSTNNHFTNSKVCLSLHYQTRYAHYSLFVITLILLHYIRQFKDLYWTQDWNWKYGNCYTFNGFSFANNKTLDPLEVSDSMGMAFTKLSAPFVIVFLYALFPDIRLFKSLAMS